MRELRTAMTDNVRAAPFHLNHRARAIPVKSVKGEAALPQPVLHLQGLQQPVEEKPPPAADPPGGSTSTATSSTISLSSAAFRRVVEVKVPLPGIDERRSSLRSSVSEREDSGSGRAAFVAATPKTKTTVAPPIGDLDCGQWTVSDDDARRSMPPLKLTDSQLVVFQRQWSRATQLYQQIQADR